MPRRWASCVWQLLLSLRHISIHKDIDRVDIEGKAILFESALYDNMPEDMSAPLALAALDVAGAPAQARKLPHAGDSVLILGANG